ncbi:ABC transporter ATP-binding protein [Paenibacillus peoriae]|uniref:ABC transporter ATP-binding protein n=1 Tax=Paenibacillus peoriae TaxID=59893 RepID=UPI00026C5886|nr:ABC transporter ATP-binding protein [Paenibacillus peoriae]MEC0182062.1 ABC transporter ATP-binding protein [Paenibacillus peoriae]
MDNQEAMKKLVRLFKPHIKAVVMLVSFIIVSSLANLLMPLISKRIMDEGLLKQNFKAVLLYSSAILFLFCIDKGMNLFKEMVRTRISAKIKKDLYQKAYSHIQRIKIAYFKNVNNTSTLNNVNQDIENMSRVTDDYVFFVVTQIFSILGGMIGLLLISWKMTLIVLSFIPLKILITYKFSRKKEQLMNSYLKRSYEYAHWFGDMLGGIRESRIFGCASYKEKEFERKIDNIVEIEKKSSMMDVFNTTFELTIMQFLTTALYIVGGSMFFSLQLTVGGIFAFITYSSYVTTPIAAIVNLKYIFSGILPSTKRFYSFLKLEQESNAITRDFLLTQDFESCDQIVFENVSFSYGTGNQILEDVNFSIKTGEKVAIVGANGSGKSTLLNLLLRFYETKGGEITLNGTNIRNLDIQDYRLHFSVLDQHFYLFDGSIEENVKLYTNLSEADLRRSVNDSGLTEFVNSHSLDYQIGPNGSRLSGGQRQKLALARALAHEKAIFIWDEADTHLDAESEASLYALLESRLKNNTIIMVTHHLDLLERSDKILLLSNGSVIQYENNNESWKDHKEYRQVAMAFSK